MVVAVFLTVVLERMGIRRESTPIDEDIFGGFQGGRWLA